MIAAATMAISLAAGADDSSRCEASPAAVATVLLNSAEPLRQLSEQHLVQAVAAPTCRQLQDMVYEFTFSFQGCGSCMPASSKLIVVQDLRATALDGPAIYTYTIKHEI